MRGLARCSAVALPAAGATTVVAALVVLLTMLWKEPVPPLVIGSESGGSVSAWLAGDHAIVLTVVVAEGPAVRASIRWPLPFRR